MSIGVAEISAFDWLHLRDGYMAISVTALPDTEDKWVFGQSQDD